MLFIFFRITREKQSLDGHNWPKQEDRNLNVKAKEKQKREFAVYQRSAKMLQTILKQAKSNICFCCVFYVFLYHATTCSNKSLKTEFVSYSNTLHISIPPRLVIYTQDIR